MNKKLSLTSRNSLKHIKGRRICGKQSLMGQEGCTLSHSAQSKHALTATGQFGPSLTTTAQWFINSECVCIFFSQATKRNQLSK